MSAEKKQRLETKAATSFRVIGSHGAENGQFSYPWGIAAALNGTIYVADTMNHRIQYFDPEGHWLGKWGSRGREDGQFEIPRCVAISTREDKSILGHLQAIDEVKAFPPGLLPMISAYLGLEEVYVVDEDFIQVFQLNGTFIRKWKHMDSIGVRGLRHSWTDGRSEQQYGSFTVSCHGFVYPACTEAFDVFGKPAHLWTYADDNNATPCHFMADPNGYIYTCEPNLSGGEVYMGCYLTDATLVNRWILQEGIIEDSWDVECFTMHRDTFYIAEASRIHIFQRVDDEPFHSLGILDGEEQHGHPSAMVYANDRLYIVNSSQHRLVMVKPILAKQLP